MVIRAAPQLRMLCRVVEFHLDEREDIPEFLIKVFLTM